jgi:hypothetical protein
METESNEDMSHETLVPLFEIEADSSEDLLRVLDLLNANQNRAIPTLRG